MNWGHWVHSATNLSSQQLAACRCVCVSVCVNVSVCWSVCIYSAWAVASSVNLCTIGCDTTWWREEPGALKWYVIMTALTPRFLAGLLAFSYFASFFSPLHLCVFFAPKETGLRHYSRYDLEWTMGFSCTRKGQKGSQWIRLLWFWILMQQPERIAELL